MEKNSYKILQTWYGSRARFPFVSLSVIRSCCTQINFFFLSNSEEPCCTPKYAFKKRYGHVDHNFDSLALFRSTCAYCMEKHVDADETQDYLRCPCVCNGFMEGALNSDFLTN